MENRHLLNRVGSSRSIKFTFAMAILSAASQCAFADTDAEKLGEARYALETAKDCKGADAALESVSANMRSDSEWVLYMAKTSECLGNIEAAINYYTQFHTLRPDQEGFADKIGELRYKQKKAQESAVRTAQIAHQLEDANEKMTQLYAESNDLDKQANEWYDHADYLEKTFKEHAVGAQEERQRGNNLRFQANQKRQQALMLQANGNQK